VCVTRKKRLQKKKGAKKVGLSPVSQRRVSPRLLALSYVDDTHGALATRTAGSNGGLEKLQLSTIPCLL
jgi:hypothetical protein